MSIDKDLLSEDLNHFINEICEIHQHPGLLNPIPEVKYKLGTDKINVMIQFDVISDYGAKIPMEPLTLGLIPRILNWASERGLRSENPFITGNTYSVDFR